MFKELVKKFFQDPFGFFARLWEKVWLLPLRYKKGRDYRAADYWRDRFARHKNTLRGVGDEGVSEEENRRQYERAAKEFVAFCGRNNIGFSGKNVLEVGVGTGFYTEMIFKEHPTAYTGVDITDMLFSQAQERFPAGRFVRADITQDRIEGLFDTVVMIDVIEHITTEQRLAAALRNVQACLKKEGLFIIAPLFKRGARRLFYLRLWAVAELTGMTEAFTVSARGDFRGGTILALKRK